MLKRLKKVMLTCIMGCMLADTLVPTQVVFATETGEVQDSYSQYAQEPVNLFDQGYDVVFCVDNSGSIWSQQSIRDNALRSIANLAVGSDIRIGGVYFADGIYKTQLLTDMSDKDGCQQILSGFLNTTDQDPNNRATNIGNALEAAIGLFENQNADRNRIVILFSDGINEDEKGSAEYKTAADAKTQEQVKILESKGIPVYCVYLQKARNDEVYLKNLVNYFNSENSYAEERFKKVTDAEISLLSKQFAEIFYDMQNNMKYREITIDSTGKTGFYVPSVGIDKIQLYLNNPGKFEAVLENKENELGIKDSWSDGNSAYVSLEKPVTGDWSLTVTGDNAAATHGTIAYYANITAYVELLKDGVPIREDNLSSANMKKNDVLQAVIHFYDGDGNEIAIDPAVQVEATLSCTTENQEEISVPISVKNENGTCISDVFNIEQYGTYRINTRLIYEDFLDLEYTTVAGEVLKDAPVAYDQKGTFLSEKTEQGQLITFKANELYYDPEGEEVSIVEVGQINKTNPVRVEQKNEIISVYAEKMGDVNFTLLIKDSTGLTGTVNIEGKIINKFMVEIMEVILGLIVLIIILLLIRKRIKSKNLLKNIGQKKILMLEETDALLNKYQKQAEKNESLVDEEVYHLAINSMNDIIQNLSDKEKENYDLARFAVGENDAEVYVNWKNASDSIQTSVALLENMKEEIESIPSTIADKKVLNRMKEYENKLSVYEKKIDSQVEACRDAANKVDEYIDDASDLYQEIDKMLNTPITCDLLVQWGDFMAAKQGRIGRGKYLKGSYEFDDIMVSGPNGMMMFREMFSDHLTNITVYGYLGKHGEEGLEFRGTVPFDIKKDGEDDCETVKCAVLLKNEQYCMVVPRHGKMNIKVK